jgi:hypothetical protein
MDQKEKRKLETELMAMGLAGLDDPNLIQQLAYLVSSWPGDKHDFLRDLLNECEPAKRYEMFNAIAPKLAFKPLSYSWYEAAIGLRAAELVSRGEMLVIGDAPKPIEINGKRFRKVSRKDATGALATLTCHHCHKSEYFLAKTPVGAMTAARDAGWVRDKGLNKEVCMECFFMPKKVAN